MNNSYLSPWSSQHRDKIIKNIYKNSLEFLPMIASQSFSFLSSLLLLHQKLSPIHKLTTREACRSFLHRSILWNIMDKNNGGLLTVWILLLIFINRCHARVNYNIDECQQCSFQVIYLNDFVAEDVRFSRPNVNITERVNFHISLFFIRTNDYYHIFSKFALFWRSVQQGTTVLV